MLLLDFLDRRVEFVHVLLEGLPMRPKVVSSSFEVGILQVDIVSFVTRHVHQRKQGTMLCRG